LRIQPSLLENTALIHDLGGDRGICFCSFCFLRSFFPHCAKFARSRILVNRLQVSTQNNGGQGQSPQELLKIPILEQLAKSSGPEPWFVTKISSSTELAEFRGSFGRENR